MLLRGIRANSCKSWIYSLHKKTFQTKAERPLPIDVMVIKWEHSSLSHDTMGGGGWGRIRSLSVMQWDQTPSPLWTNIKSLPSRRPRVWAVIIVIDWHSWKNALIFRLKGTAVYWNYDKWIIITITIIKLTRIRKSTATAIDNILPCWKLQLWHHYLQLLLKCKVTKRKTVRK